MKGITGKIYVGIAYQDPSESWNWYLFARWSSFEDDHRTRQIASASVSWGQTEGDHL
jgi:hypothetical protein